MATFVKKNTARAGTTLNLAQSANGGGDDFLNTGRELLLVTNTDASSHTITVVIPANANRAEGKVVGPRTVVVAAGAYVLAGPFPTALHNDGTGKTALTYSSATGMKVEVIDPTLA